MARDERLIYALLAMDAYHRGADGGLNGLIGKNATLTAAIDGMVPIQPSPSRHA